MRGACTCAMVCAMVAAVLASEGGGGDELRLDSEAARRLHEEGSRQLLALLGMGGRPTRRVTSPPRVPPPLRRLYAAQVLPAAHANTARTYHHQPSELDRRFPADHRVRLYFNVSVPSDERARGATLTLSRIAVSDDTADARPQRLLLYDIVRPGRRGQTTPILRLIDSREVHAGDEDAVQLDAVEAVRRWLAEPKHNHGLLVRVLDATGEDAAKPRVRVRRRAEDAEPLWPLLVLYTEDGRARAAREAAPPRLLRPPPPRERRAAPRRPHRTHHRRKETREICQRRPLYVDFADVGWNDWIVAPHGYDAYYCQGDCPFPLADHLNGTNHAIVQTLVNSVNPGAVPKACCVPTQLSSISMLFIDEENNLVLKNYQDMMVVGCGCR